MAKKHHLKITNISNPNDAYQYYYRSLKNLLPISGQSWHRCLFWYISSSIIKVIMLHVCSVIK